ncbi:calcium binding EGF domain protein [Ancylostoma duodenale]|uniref:Calcium binding EGF domain protein n=1 Tax=Ancylostoma duodenale TaxID=51022 RepID=A0A0C2D295_9BILA|nr:calcium binding EGF domain protein [Ancylostoma duodenale]
MNELKEETLATGDLEPLALHRHVPFTLTMRPANHPALPPVLTPALLISAINRVPKVAYAILAMFSTIPGFPHSPVSPSINVDALTPMEILIQRYGCDQHAICSVSDEKMACVCLPGFTGNGTTCVDIDECLDPTTCNADKGHGNCTNTIGSYHCDCVQFFTQPHCQNYQPRRHCADLRRYWDITDDGVYSISPPYAFAGSGSFGDAAVYCDMNTDGGGWTLMSSDRNSGMAGRTYQEYIEGFGAPSEQQVWLGLDLIKGMTNYENTSHCRACFLVGLGTG